VRSYPPTLIFVVAAVACGRTGLSDTALDGESVLEADAASPDSSTATDAPAEEMTDSTTGPESGADASSGRDGTIPPPPPLDGSLDVTDAPPPLDAPPDIADGASAEGGICGPGNCPFGCCNGFGECVQPSNNTCGWFGSACQQCASNATCIPGMGCAVTLQTCDPSNCAGCCDNGRVPALCLPGTFTFTCGFGGAACTFCNPGQQCRPLLYDAGGLCQSSTTCDSTTCTGCCIGNVCAQGDQQNACGLGGMSCQNCGQDQCVVGLCRCGGPNGGLCDAGAE
jgi:hypothetical protein